MPSEIGLIDAFWPVMAPLLERAAAGGGALGRSGIGVRAFVAGVLRGDISRRRGVFAPAMERNTLNDYIEAQVHGVVSLRADVEALVIDSAFTGTPTGELLLATAQRCGFEAEWHPGSALAVSEVPEDVPAAEGTELMRWQAFCAGGRARRLAERVIAEHGEAPHLDAANIGEAAASVVRDPERWHDWGTPLEMRQYLKDLWSSSSSTADGCARTSRLVRRWGPTPSKQWLSCWRRSSPATARSSARTSSVSICARRPQPPRVPRRAVVKAA